MGRILSVACLAVAFSFASVSAGFGADAPMPDLKESIVLLAAAQPQIAGGRLIDETIKELDQRSATFDQMLRTLVAAHVLTFISPWPDASLVSGVMGRTRFAVSASRIVAFVEVRTPRDQLWIRREAIAHELAHVVEVACMGTIESKDSLGRHLQRQLTWSSDRNTAHPLETRFAVRAGKAVLHEAQKNDRGTGQLAELAEREGLSGCPAMTSGRELASLDPLD